MDTRTLLGVRSTVDTVQEAVTTLEFLRKHLEDIGHGCHAEEVTKVRTFIVRFQETIEKEHGKGV